MKNHATVLVYKSLILPYLADTFELDSLDKVVC